MKWKLKRYQGVLRCEVRDQYDRQCNCLVAVDNDGNYDPEHMCEAHKDMFDHWIMLLSSNGSHP